MAESDCIKFAEKHYRRTRRKKDAKGNFDSTYYFFLGGEYRTAQTALQTAERRGFDADSDCIEYQPLMDEKNRDAILDLKDTILSKDLSEADEFEAKAWSERKSRELRKELKDMLGENIADMLTEYIFQDIGEFQKALRLCLS